MSRLSPVAELQGQTHHEHMAGGGDNLTGRPICAGCGDRIGVYEPVLREGADAVADRTSWLGLHREPSVTAADRLWHEACGRAAGLRVP
jgi:hypothetical protein